MPFLPLKLSWVGICLIMIWSLRVTIAYSSVIWPISIIRFDVFPEGLVLCLVLFSPFCGIFDAPACSVAKPQHGFICLPVLKINLLSNYISVLNYCHSFLIVLNWFRNNVFITRREGSSGESFLNHCVQQDG